MADHLVKSYDEQLSILTNTIAKMGALAEKQIKDSTEALLTNDQEFVDEIVGKDDRIDELENEPAYKRAQVDMNDDNSLSRLSVETDSSDETRIRTNNSFLHDNVD